MPPNLRTGHLLVAGLLAAASLVLLGRPVAVGSVPSPERAVAPCSSADYLWAHLAKCGRAGPGSTGPRRSRCPDGLRPLGSTLVSVIELRTPGQRISCRRITGCLSVEATDVVIRDVAIRCDSGRRGEDANGTGVVKIHNGASATIAHASIDGRSGVHACLWHEGLAMVARRINCRGVDDGVFTWPGPDGNGDHFRLVRSYVHDLTHATANGHVDAFQTSGTGHGLIEGNTFLMTTDEGNDANAAIGIFNGNADTHDIVVRGNLIAGGGFAVYALDYSPSEEDPEGGYRVDRITFTDNVFSRHLYGCVGYYGVWFWRGGPSDAWNRSGNTLLETGTSLDAGNPTFQGHHCL